jgi:hypothetical protein
MVYWEKPSNNFLDVSFNHIFCDRDNLYCPTDSPLNSGCGDFGMICGTGLA